MVTEYDMKFIIRTVGQRPDEWYNKNNYAQLRYGKFMKALEGKKAGFVQFEDIINHLYAQADIPVYSFENGRFQKTNDVNLDARIVATEVFESIPVDFQTKKKYLNDTLDLFTKLKETGRVEHFVNPIESIKSQDKSWLLDVQKDMPDIPLAPVTTYNSKKELEDFYNQSNEQYILKGRLGMAGTATMKLNEETLENITDKNIHHYVVQKDVSPVVCELRFVYGPDQKHLGTRSYFDRRAPWEDAKTSNKQHKAIQYIESDYEKDISSKIIKYAGVDVGSADWLVSLPQGTTIPNNLNAKEFSEFIQKNGTYSLAEVNGFGTNLGPLVSPYDLNEEVIKRITNKYL